MYNDTSIAINPLAFLILSTDLGNGFEEIDSISSKPFPKSPHYFTNTYIQRPHIILHFDAVLFCE
jgi:hypothetical protein